MSTLEERVAGLESRGAAQERALRQWRRGGVVGLGLLGVLVAAGLAEPSAKTLQGTRLVIVDEAGKERLVLAASSDGAGLRINAPDGTLRAALGEGKVPGLGDGAGLWLFDKGGKPRVGLGMGDADGPGMVMLDEQGKPVVPAKGR